MHFSAHLNTRSCANARMDPCMYAKLEGLCKYVCLETQVQWNDNNTHQSVFLHSGVVALFAGSVFMHHFSKSLCAVAYASVFFKSLAAAEWTCVSTLCARAAKGMYANVHECE